MAKTINSMFFIENLHLMYSKTNLLKMSTASVSSFEDAFLHKKNNTIKGNVTSEALDIQMMIDKLKMLFSLSLSYKEGGGISLDKLKNKIREKIQQIKPRPS